MNSYIVSKVFKKWIIFRAFGDLDGLYRYYAQVLLGQTISELFGFMSKGLHP